ncbi:putative hydro-lyase [Xenophilus aerolatus]|nr:putative hydro-lyase [Xenophilus aerolatus]
MAPARLDPRAESAPDGRSARRLVRSGAYTGHTAGMAPGHVQANLAILPRAQADDFLRFCQRNPRPCPLLAVSEPGEPFLPTLGEDLDIRSDVPRYRVWRGGVPVDEPSDIGALWRDDLVSFVIGCSFTFETALLQAGVPLRHVAQGRNVAMFRTDIPTTPAGPFHGPLVVSMRPLKAADAIRAVQVTSRFPGAHGAPVHLGDPSRIGIVDVTRPDWGDAVEIADDELPVFWACGVTPQAVIEAARLPFCITHAPGHMLVTDWRDHQLAVL